MYLYTIGTILTYIDDAVLHIKKIPTQLANLSGALNKSKWLHIDID